MVNCLNNIKRHIKLTFETHMNNKLNFLDFTVTLIDNTFDFIIYIKPTQMNATMSHDSNQPYSQKNS